MYLIDNQIDPWHGCRGAEEGKFESKRDEDVVEIMRGEPWMWGRILGKELVFNI